MPGAWDGKRKRKRATATASIGGKRKGRRLAVKPREQAAANLTARDIRATLDAAPDALAHLNGRGVVKLLTYSAK
ncbi:MAG: hypothetical protein H0U23_04840 [Blastocatellia bacterium]|nr:hypothetical protein [Blastocatellia bacterium]